MKALKSKINIWYYTVMLLSGVGVFCLMGVAMTIAYIDKYTQSVVMLVLIPMCFALPLYTLYYFFIKVPGITITDNKIIIKASLKKTEIGFENIESVALTGKSFIYIMGSPSHLESTTITTKNKQEIILCDILYRNIGAIKSRLEQISKGIETGDFKPAKDNNLHKTSVNLRSEHFEVFRGNALANSYTQIVLGGMIVGIIIIQINNPNFAENYWLMLFQY